MSFPTALSVSIILVEIQMPAKLIVVPEFFLDERALREKYPTWNRSRIGAFFEHDSSRDLIPEWLKQNGYELRVGDIIRRTSYWEGNFKEPGEYRTEHYIVSDDRAMLPMIVARSGKLLIPLRAEFSIPKIDPFYWAAIDVIAPYVPLKYGGSNEATFTVANVQMLNVSDGFLLTLSVPDGRGGVYYVFDKHIYPRSAENIASILAESFLVLVKIPEPCYPREYGYEHHVSFVKTSGAPGVQVPSGIDPAQALFV